MCIGVGFGDFVTLSKFASDVRNAYQHAPSEFSCLSKGVESLQIVIEDYEKKFRNTNLRSEDQQRLKVVLQGCSGVLEELKNFRTKYKKLEAPQSSRFMFIDRLRWDSREVETLRGKVTENISLLNTWAMR